MSEGVGDEKTAAAANDRTDLSPLRQVIVRRSKNYRFVFYKVRISKTFPKYEGFLERIS